MKKEDFLEAYLSRCYSEEGELYGMPFQIAQMCLFYNKDLFVAAGLDPEMPPVTWDEYLEYAEKMTDSSKNTFGSGLYYCYQAQLGAFTQRFGGLVVDKNTDGKYKVNLKNNDALKDGLNYFYPQTRLEVPTVRKSVLLSRLRLSCRVIVVQRFLQTDCH